MTKFSTAAWKTKSQERKAYRDHYRSKFFRQNGVSKGADAMMFSGAPKSQRRRILKLMKITKKGGALSSDQEAMMTLLAVEMAKTGLGVGEMGGVAKTQMSFDEFSFTNLRDFFY